MKRISKERLKEKEGAIISVIANGGWGGGGLLDNHNDCKKTWSFFISSCDIPAIRIQVVHYLVALLTSSVDNVSIQLSIQQYFCSVKGYSHRVFNVL